ELICSRCDWTAHSDGSIWQCAKCRGPLDWNGPNAFDRSMIDGTIPSLWRYGAGLPVAVSDAVTLGEHISPLIATEFDGVPVHWKLDHLMPSGSFKDRGSTVLISHLKNFGVSRAVEDSSGNAAASIAAYAARAGISASIFAPAAASRGKLVQTAAS